MKKLLTFILGVILLLSLKGTTAYASDTEEMRGAWIATVFSHDWPSSKDPETQKQEFINILNNLKTCGINSVFVQVRPEGDALYSSDINIWSRVLTGTQGKNPGYDPLQFMIDETHKRGMKFHAWFNPYRVTTSGTDLNSLAPDNPARKNPDWVLSDGSALYYNPGLAAVRQYIVDTVSEVVKKYNVDGIQFDDYFYKGNFNDDDTFKNSGTSYQDKGDWRRENVNYLIREVHSAIKSIKPNVEFGVSPRGIWQNAASGTSGAESYYQDYADSLKWVQNEWVDYIAPQIYWTFENSAAPYGKLIDWWSQQVKGRKVKLYIGQAVYDSNVSAQLSRQIAYNRSKENVQGSILFRTNNILQNTNVQKILKESYNPAKVQLIGRTRYETTASISKYGWNSADTVLIVNGQANADGITATPLASSYNAPILLSDLNTLPDATRAELKRLNPSKVILIGGSGVLSDQLINDIRSVNSAISVERIGGKTRYETSLLIAKRIDAMNDISKAFICYGLGEADALSIAAKAGQDRIPIILTESKSLPADTLSWLGSEGLQDAYFIGGTGILHDSVVSQVNGITALDVSGNRLAGSTRYGTNAAVINKFYSSSDLESVFVTKGLVLADALTAGPLAAKNNSPVVIVDSQLSAEQQSVLSVKRTNKVYEVGGGVVPSSLQCIIDCIR